MARSHKTLAKRLTVAALAYPEAYEDNPWGDVVYKVKGKIFAFIGTTEEGLYVTAKLPSSNGAALMMSFAEPTGYGLGKAGWVTARIAHDEPVPEEMLREWIDESYRAIAPKKLVKTLDAPPVEPLPKKTRKK